MEARPFQGTGYAMLDLWEAVRSGWLASCDDRALSLYVVLGVHANRSHLAWPSVATMARLGGISKSSVGPALEWLESRGMIKSIKWGSRKRYQVRMVVDGPTVAIRHHLVRNGIWAQLTPTARKVFITLQAHSLPGAEPFYFESSRPEDWRNAVHDGQGLEGSRHVYLEFTGTSWLAERCGVVNRTIQLAMNELNDMKLIVDPGDDLVLVLPNDVDYFYPELVSAAKSEADSRSKLIPGLKRSLTARRKRREQTEPSVPRKGKSPMAKREPPSSEGEAPPNSLKPNAGRHGENGTQRAFYWNVGDL